MGRLGFVLVGVGVVLLLAGCGGKTTYSIDRTKTCLTERGVKVGGRLPSDFVAGTATGGAFVAHLGDNFVTVAFGTTLKNGTDIQSAYTTFAGANIRAGITDVLRRFNNAVTLWHKHPSDSDLALIVGCLR